MRPDGPRDPIVGPESGPEAPFPLKVNGKVIKGFGRGSSDLGIPTANIPLEGLSIGGHDDIESGIYYGWAGLSPCEATQQSPSETTGKWQHLIHAPNKAENGAQDESNAGTGTVYPMVMSVGWNPFYKNKVRSIEVHIMNDFKTGFYGAHMNLLICGFIRPEYDYVDMQSLIDDIRTDIDVAGNSLSRTRYLALRTDAYLLDFENKTDSVS